MPQHGEKNSLASEQGHTRERSAPEAFCKAFCHAHEAFPVNDFNGMTPDGKAHASAAALM